MTLTKKQSAGDSPCCGNIVPWMMLLGLVVVGFSSRMLIADIPNFKPIAAIALFSGFYFRKSWMALLATGLALLISDWQIGSYHWPIALSVYGSLLVGCVIGRYFLGAHVHGLVNRRPAKRQAVKTATAAVSMSCLFFVVTNFAVWASGVWYPQGFDGLVSCYVNAVPFFKYTLAGDVFFTGAIFGTYALASAFLKSRSNVAELSCCPLSILATEKQIEQ